MMNPITTFSARALTLLVENIDTDQIIPARFLTGTDKTGLGESLFADWRFDEAGRPIPGFVLNGAAAQDAQILVAGHNFGCGSSREHAPWALLAYGFRAVVSTYFAEIFRSNALKNGLLPITVDSSTLTRITELLENEPQARLEVDLVSRTLRLPDGTATEFPVEPFAKHCLVNGLDQLGFLLREEKEIARYEAAHPARVCTRPEIEAV